MNYQPPFQIVAIFMKPTVYLMKNKSRSIVGDNASHECGDSFGIGSYWITNSQSIKFRLDSLVTISDCKLDNCHNSFDLIGSAFLTVHCLLKSR